MIQNIDINKLQHHPLNPRKDYGDIEELAESIRINGILQNMTVVPAENGMFNVVIGNRRLEAAKKAGLTVCACFVSKKNVKALVSAMMQENLHKEESAA